jgi:hypothetical protein
MRSISLPRIHLIGSVLSVYWDGLKKLAFKKFFLIAVGWCYHGSFGESTLRQRLALVAVLAVSLVSGCGDSTTDSTDPSEDTLASLIAEADERAIFYQVDIQLSSPLSSGRADIYLFMDGETTFVESRRFDNPDPALHVGYSAPLSVDSSAILIHVVTAGLSASRPDEYVCFADISHTTSRHSLSLPCDYSSTVPYYFSVHNVGRSDLHPFHDIEQRLPLWRALVNATENDVNGFYVSVFGTLQRALAGMGQTRFDHKRHSLRPVMETVVGQFIDRYQRQGSIRASELVAIANQVTDYSLPIERIARYQTVFEEFAHIEDVSLTNTGGSLTQKTNELELLTMSSELGRFYLRNAPYEMSDYRTHIVQNVRHESLSDTLYVNWDPIGHMFGYNVYFNGQHVGYSRVPGIELPPNSRGVVTIKAVGYAGEFDGVHHELSDPTLIAGVDNESQ